MALLREASGMLNGLTPELTNSHNVQRLHARIQQALQGRTAAGG
jgi:hypothetical protein